MALPGVEDTFKVLFGLTVMLKRLIVEIALRCREERNTEFTKASVNSF